MGHPECPQHATGVLGRGDEFNRQVVWQSAGQGFGGQHQGRVDGVGHQAPFAGPESGVRTCGDGTDLGGGQIGHRVLRA